MRRLIRTSSVRLLMRDTICLGLSRQAKRRIVLMRTALFTLIILWFGLECVICYYAVAIQTVALYMWRSYWLRRRCLSIAWRVRLPITVVYSSYSRRIILSGKAIMLLYTARCSNAIRLLSLSSSLKKTGSLRISACSSITLTSKGRLSVLNLWFSGITGYLLLAKLVMSGNLHVIITFLYGQQTMACSGLMATTGNRLLYWTTLDQRRYSHSHIY